MGYMKAADILPAEVIELIQQYVDGESIYIPRKEDSRKKWGSNTAIKEELLFRNKQICADYDRGMNILKLADKYYLSEKSIQRIIRDRKKHINDGSV